MQERVSNSDFNFFKSWIANRKKGMMKFAFSHGLIYGILLFFFTGLFDLSDKSFSEVFFSQGGLKALSLWLLVGVFGYGLSMWWFNQYIFTKRLRKYDITEDELITQVELNKIQEN